MGNKIIMHVRPAKIIHDGGGEPYQGEYNVTPSLYNDIELETAGKTLAENITVAKIPYTAQVKKAVPSMDTQVIIPDAMKYLERVEVAPIPYTYSDNEYGGQTLTIG